MVIIMIMINYVIQVIFIIIGNYAYNEYSIFIYDTYSFLIMMEFFVSTKINWDN